MSRLFDRPIAHRGLHDREAGIIENSRSAFDAAIAHGYAIECDVQLSSDGEPFIFHDDDFARLTSAVGRSSSLPIDEVVQLKLKDSAANETPQRFSEMLHQVAGRTMLQIELKQQATAAQTARLAAVVAEQLRDYRGPYALESFDPNLLVALRRARLRAPLGIITYGYDVPEWTKGLAAWKRVLLRHLLHWPLTRFDFISCRYVSLGLPAVRFFRSLGMPVTSWTIETPAAAVEALRAADQIVFEGFLPASA